MKLTWNDFVDSAATVLNLNDFAGFSSLCSSVLDCIELGTIVPGDFDPSEVCNLFSHIENLSFLENDKLLFNISLWRK